MVYRHHHHSIFMELHQKSPLNAAAALSGAHQDAVSAHSQKLQPLSSSSVIEATSIWSPPFIFLRTGQTSWQTEKKKYLIPQKKMCLYG
jgi:hypothetical protein